MDVHKNTTHVIASKTRRTAKVQVAARNPAIKIVTTNWLFDCVSQWKRLPEQPYLIPVESKHKEVTRGVSPVFQEPPNGDLSSSEEEAGGDGEKGPSLKLNIGDLPDVDEEQEDQAGSVSPADLLTDDQWSAMFAEIEEDVSDTEDGDTDADDDESDGSSSSVQSNKKRKRDVGAVEAVPASPSDSDGGQRSTNGSDTGSKLQQRKRRALERTSSLTKIAQVTQGGGPTTTTTTTKETNGINQSKARSPRASTPASEAGSETGENAAMQAELEALLNAADTDED
jgi:RNA polymerase II subunit A-like phosphatase